MKWLLSILMLLILTHTNLAQAGGQTLQSQGFDIQFNPNGGFLVKQNGIDISYNSMLLSMEPPWKTHWFYAAKHKPLIIATDNSLEVKTDPNHPSTFYIESYKLTILSQTSYRLSIRGKLTKDVPAFVTHVPISIPENLLIGAKIDFDGNTMDMANYVDQTMPASPPFKVCTIQGNTHTITIRVTKGSPYTLQDRRTTPYLGKKCFILLESNKMMVKKDQIFEQEFEFSVTPTTNGPPALQPMVQKTPATPAVLKTTGFFGMPDSSKSLADIVHAESSYQGKFTWTDYQKILTEITKPRYRVLSLKEFATEQAGDNVLIGMRHDIDSHPEKALTMAKMEAKAGIGSTYLFLHSASYYGKVKNGIIYRNAAIDQLAKKLFDQGFEIGIHTDLFTMMWDYQFDPVAFTRAEIDYYKKIGIPVFGSAAHGSGTVIRKGFNNMWMFSEFNHRGSVIVKGKKYEYGQHPLADYGLTYEGYLLKKSAYTGDIDKRFRNKPVEELIAYIASIPKGSRVEILIHPEHWGMTTKH